MASFSGSDSLDRFIALVAADQPAPAGGSVAAVVVALAAGLVEKTARLSREWDEARAVAAQARQLRERMLPLAVADADAYAEVLEALRTPPDAPPEQRDFALGQALSRAADLPLAIAEAAGDVAALAEHAVEHGNPNLRGDAAAAAVLAEAAARAAANLVAINLSTTEDDARIGVSERIVTAAAESAARALTATTS